MKKILAIAIATAFAAPAFAATSNVDISGQLNVSYDYLKGKDGAVPANMTSQSNISSNASFIQFSGSEDMGGGLSAVWALKTYVSMGGTGNSGDPYNLTKSDGFTNGPAYAGLSSKDMGTVLLGKMEGPFKVLGRKTDLFGNTLGDTRNLGSTFDTRPSNTVAYVSPNLSGFQATVAYFTNLDTTATTSTSVDGYSASAVYTNGPLLAGLGYEKHDNSNAAATNSDESAWRLGATYKFGDFKVTGMYLDQSDLGGVSGADQKVYGLGGAYMMGANDIKLQWTKATDKASVSNTGANMYSVGFDHHMSKRTTLYAVYAKVDNGSGASFSEAGAGHGDNPGTVTGQDPSGFSVGMIHNF